MFNPSQPSFTNLPSHFPNQFSHPTDPSRPYLPVPQPLIFSSAVPLEPQIHPPGTNPYADIGSQPQASLVEDPNAHFHNWVVREAAPIRYDIVTETGNETLLLSPSLNSLYMHQPPLTGVTNNVPQQTNVAQTIRCDDCNVDCSNKDIFEKHLQGKKHNKNMQVRNNPTSTVLATSNAIDHIGFPSQMGMINGQLGFGTSTVTASPDMEIKTRKVLNSGSTVDSVRVCTICNVVCNSQDVFNKHMTGRKHAVQAGLAALGEIGPYFAAVRAQFDCTYKKAPKKTKIVQSAWCEVCKINCNSNDVYIAHLSGKKHQRNLEHRRKLTNDPSAASSSSSLSPSTYPMIGPEENPEASNSKSIAGTPKSPKKATQEDMQAKRQKIVAAGAAAGAIRTCTICNVVCNSQTVFNFHLGGQKHKDMVKKLQEAGVAVTDP